MVNLDRVMYATCSAAKLDARRVHVELLCKVSKLELADVVLMKRLGELPLPLPLRNAGPALAPLSLEARRPRMALAAWERS